MKSTHSRGRRVLPVQIVSQVGSIAMVKVLQDKDRAYCFSSLNRKWNRQDCRANGYFNTASCVRAGLDRKQHDHNLKKAEPPIPISYSNVQLDRGGVGINLRLGGGPGLRRTGVVGDAPRPHPAFSPRPPITARHLRTRTNGDARDYAYATRGGTRLARVRVRPGAAAAAYLLPLHPHLSRSCDSKRPNRPWRERVGGCRTPLHQLPPNPAPTRVYYPRPKTQTKPQGRLQAPPPNAHLLTF
ncbi:hypothetical protein NL676_034625 [Syzygium grande]|nr:hypothetical protein NL676_034625 [Syzygium grande]